MRGISLNVFRNVQLRIVNGSGLSRRLTSQASKENTSNSPTTVAQETKVAETATSQNINSTPTQMVELTPFYRYLVFKFSNHKYESKDKVPNRVPIGQLNYAKDKGRARATVYFIGFTILGSLVSVIYGKSLRNKGYKYSDELIKQHAQYSKAHQDILRSAQLEDNQHQK